MRTKALPLARAPTAAPWRGEPRPHRESSALLSRVSILLQCRRGRKVQAHVRKIGRPGVHLAQLSPSGRSWWFPALPCQGGDAEVGEALPSDGEGRLALDALN